MPDKRRHRGPHPGDVDRFGPAHVSALRDATRDLSLLLGRGYAVDSSLALVGDRYDLDRRQRLAVRRASCTDDQRAARAAKRSDAAALRDREIWIDGFNVLTTVEASLAGGVLLRCRDGCLRDMASMHGSWRRVEETRPALERIADVLVGLHIAAAHWLFDEPVSNSGRIAALVREVAAERALGWTAASSRDPDRELIAAPNVVVASVDSMVLDGCAEWFDLADASAAAHPALDLRAT